MSIFSSAKKLGKKALKHRKLILTAATLLAPGAVAKGAAQVAKLRDKAGR